VPRSRIDHLLLLKRLFRLAGVFFKGKETRKARIFLAALAGLSLAIGLVQIVMSYAARDFITTLTQRDQAGWIRAMWRYIGTFALSVPIAVFYRYCGERLSLSCRTHMTDLLVKRYFFNKAYYGLRGTEAVDNPDQGISEDIRVFTTMVVNFAPAKTMRICSTSTFASPASLMSVSATVAHCENSTTTS
jgi:putative ATP-binding cassette transporter